MAANDTTTVKLDLDNSEFMEKMSKSLGLMGDFGDSVEGVKDLAEKLGEVGLILGVVAAAVLAVTTAVDWVEEAEKIKQVNAAFDAMSASVGLVADVLKDQLIKATEGLATELDVLTAANKSLAVLGENASKLPQIMDLARRQTALFGGDLIVNFENLGQALARGNVRALAHMGIMVDAKKAVDNYGKSVGLGTDYLTAAEKKQAVFNEAMAQAETKFANVNLEMTHTSNTLQRISVDFKEMKEIAIVAWNAVAGPTVSGIIDKLGSVVSSVKTRITSMFGAGEKQAEARKQLIKDQIAEYEEVIKANENALIPLGKWLGLTKIQSDKLKDLKAELAHINEEEERREQRRSAAAIATDKTSATPGAVTPKLRGDQDKIRADKAKFEDELLKLREARIKAEEKIEISADELSKRHDEEISRIFAQSEQKKAELTDKYAVSTKTSGIVNAQQLADAKTQIEKKAIADVSLIQQKYHQDQITALKNLQAQNQFTAAGFETAWRLNSAQAGQDLRNFGKFGDTAFKSVSSSAVGAFKAMGDGSKNASEAMKGFMFGALGQIAEKQGEAMLLMGIWPPNPVAIAAGGALIALGAAMSSLGSGGGTSSSAGSGSYAAAPGGGGSAPLSAPSAQPAATARTVTVAIGGNYFETDQTRTRLMEMIRESGDFTDFQLKNIGQA